MKEVQLKSIEGKMSKISSLMHYRVHLKRNHSNENRFYSEYLAQFIKCIQRNYEGCF